MTSKYKRISQGFFGTKYFFGKIDGYLNQLFFLLCKKRKIKRQQP